MPRRYAPFWEGCLGRLGGRFAWEDVGADMSRGQAEEQLYTYQCGRLDMGGTNK